MPQLLFLPLQQCRGPPFSLWSQHWTGPPFSFWTQAPLAKVNSTKLSAKTSIKAWCFVNSIGKRVVTLARAGRLGQNLSARRIYLEISKIRGWPESRRKFQMFSPFAWQRVKVPRSQNIVRWQNAFLVHKKTLCAPEGWQHAKSGWQISKTQSFILTTSLCFFNKLRGV